MKFLISFIVLGFSVTSLASDNCTTLASKYLKKYDLGGFFSPTHGKITFKFDKTEYQNRVNGILNGGSTSHRWPDPPNQDDYTSLQGYLEAMDNYSHKLRASTRTDEYKKILANRKVEAEELKTKYHLNISTEMFDQDGKENYDAITFFGGAGDSPPRRPSVGVFSLNGKNVGMVIHLPGGNDDVLQFTSDSGKCSLASLSRIINFSDGSHNYSYSRADGCRNLDKMKALAQSLPSSVSEYEDLMCTSQGAKVKGPSCVCPDGKQIFPTDVANDQAACFGKRKLTDADRLEKFFADSGLDPNDSNYGLPKFNEIKSQCDVYSADWSKSYSESPESDGAGDGNPAASLMH